MRRMVLAVAAALGTVLFLVTPASAAPSPAPVPSGIPGQNVCTVDPALAGITGLVATSNGYAVVVKAASGINMKIYVLDGECKRTKALAYSGAGPHDPQDMQISSDGTFWVADIGDDIANPTRNKIALWKVTEGKATLYRFTYPDGAAHAGEAMLLNGDGNPIFITTTTSGASGLFMPTAALDPSGNAVPLKHVGDFTPQKTGTSNKLGPVGQTRVTGAANAPDGKHVAIRTYSDAYEWSVAGGDVVAAVTKATPRITPLPDEPQGEAIAYSKDGANFLTVSDLTNKQQGATQILKYQPSPPTAPVKADTGSAPSASKGDTRGWFSKLGLQDIMRVIAAVGVVGLLMVVAGVIGIQVARKRRPPAGNGKRRNEPLPYDDSRSAGEPAEAMASATGGRRSGGLYGAYRGDQPPEPEPRRGTVYGGDDRAYDDRGHDDRAYDDRAYDDRAYDDRAYDDRAYDERGYGDRGYDHPDGDADPYARPTTNGGAPSRPRGSVARSHRSGGRRDSWDSGDGRRGYSHEHGGFGDMLE
jgi:hypothetical protein